ncbi:hypothetical protein [Paenibacillus sp. sgz500958]|uniref:hypothetical protein n=1 Tax=Paenibacillus sp. sgz500958 TaxID=3242475 RepID=UPI0036D40E2D
MQTVVIIVFLVFLLYVSIKRHRHIRRPEVRQKLPRKTLLFIEISNYATFVLFGIMVVLGIIQYLT